MKTLAAASLCALALLAPGSAGAADYGVTEDMGKAAPEWILQTIQDLGMTRNVVSLTFDAADPDVLPQASEIDALVAHAPDYGVQIGFAVYQRRAASLASPVALAAFSSWLERAAARWPTVRTWIAPNEPNQPRFWQPQFTPGCGNASGAAYFRAQATMYDTLKTIDAANEVVGVALSPRGNDNCRAESNVSTSPVRFLRSLGTAMRASGRNRPIMDALSQHPYPLLNTHGPSVGYRWPNVGVANLDRLKQAFWDAFAGTAQPTFEDGLRVYLDELGWQTASEGEAYDGVENVPVVDEATQGRYYAQAVRLAECDPAVAALNFFHLIDERPRERFQSGLLWADGTRKESFVPVRSAILAARDRGCTGVPVRWRHTTAVVGASVRFGGAGRRRTVAVGAREDATFAAAVVPAGTATPAIGRMLASTAASTGVQGTVRAYRAPVVRVPVTLRPGRRYVVAVRIVAAVNPRRSSVLVGPPFTLP